ncbi:hypothetical protein HY358_01005 [Candidatus Roizmanbacteria bacterium]|nr:hypothetical protein [Candidatus Roizmanbacteria bacterium]
MKKETLIAIVLGVGLGIVVAVFLVIKNRQAQIQKSKPITTTLAASPTAVTSNSNVEVLTLLEPQDGIIVKTNKTIIKGTVAKDSLVIIESPIKNIIVKNAPEKLDVEFPLALGENIIHITVYPKDPKIASKEKVLKVFYLDEQ